MNEDTINLLKECNSGCKSATNSLEQILSHVKNEKLRGIIIKYNDMHIKLGDECHEMLNDTGEDEKDPGMIAKTMAAVGTDIKLTIDDSVHKAADLLVDGCAMGIKSLSGYVNKYCTADDASRDIANRLINIEKDLMDELLQFL